MDKENKTELEIQMENINSNYLTDKQIELYLEACLDHKITNCVVEPDTSFKERYDANPEEFKRLVKNKSFSEQDNLFYRAWVYQYEGLKELLNPETQLNIRDGGNSFYGKNYNETKNGKNTDKEKKNVSFRFTLGSIDIRDLQRENLFYKQLKENPNVNFDEYKPKEKEIDEQKKELKIIFLYVNLGVPLLEDDAELGENNKLSLGQHKYKYEYDIDRIIYYRKITFDLYENDNSFKCQCHPTQQPKYYWILEERKNGNRKVACSQCLPKTKENDDKKELKLIENTKYSIRYFLYCNIQGHYTKKYEYYCNNCKRPYCIKCLSNEHKELNEKHDLFRIDSEKLELEDKSFYMNKVKEINLKKIKNDKIWEEINNAGDNAEKSLRERESKAIVDVKNEVLARCTFLTSLGYELHRMISELDYKTKYIEDLKKDSNIATYLNMNNMFLDDLKNHYIPNLEKIEALPLESFLETFHKIDKKYPDNKKKARPKSEDGEEEEEENEDNESNYNGDDDEDE
jgi:hypothetical protein